MYGLSLSSILSVIKITEYMGASDIMVLYNATLNRTEGIEGMGFYFAFSSLVISRKNGKSEPGRNVPLFTNSSKESFSCRRTIDSPLQRRTFI